MYLYKPYRILLDEFLERKGHYIKGRTLDIGAGSFNRYQSFFDIKEYLKMDIQSGANVDVVASVEKIPFDEGTFDSVVSIQVFEHLPDPFKAAAEIYRVLKKGGYCLITAPQINELHEIPADYFRYTRFGLEEIFQKQGFRVIEYEQLGGFFTMQASLTVRYLIDKLNLPKRSWYRLANFCFKFFTKLMRFLDRIDQSKANRSHTLGWCLILQK